MVDVRVLQTPDEPALLRFLESRPDTTMFLRGNLATAGIEDHGERYQGTYVGAFEDDAIVAVAGHFWNGNLIIEAPRFLREVVRETVRASPRGVQGLTGIHAYVQEARAFLGLQDAPASMDSREILYRLELAHLLVPAALASGQVTCRRATLDDLPVLHPWGCAYSIEALGMEPGPELDRGAAQSIRSRVEAERKWILEADGTPVSTTSFNTETSDCVQVGGVYTPPELRSRGYGACAVAGSLLDAREEGAVRSILFTGEDNPAAQRCYMNLGYEVVGDYHLLMLRDAHDVRV